MQCQQSLQSILGQEEEFLSKGNWLESAIVRKVLEFGVFVLHMVLEKCMQAPPKRSILGEKHP